MSSDRQPPPAPGRLGDLDESALAVLAGLAVVGAILAVNVGSRHPAVAAAGVLALAAAAGGSVWIRARVLDAAARRHDPRGPGIVIGSVRGDWRLAARRPFVLPWPALLQHVLICGPTGRGKTFAFIKPLLRANVARPDTGVFYLDGKGDRLDRPHDGQPGVRFDAVFCPAEPLTSARWNPLAGPDPVRAASDFAAALYPDSSGSAAGFYEARAVFAITRVAPAMALTGYGLGGASTWKQQAADADALVRRLCDAGLRRQAAQQLARRFPERCTQQLAWLPWRPSGSDLAELVRCDARPPAATPLRLLAGVGEDVSPAALSRVLFGAGELEALTGAVQAAASRSPRRLVDLLEQLGRDVAALQALPVKERASMLSNLHNRLGWFLQPPFLELCGRSDFRIADVAAGRHIAFLLPTGAFPDVAAALGRVALAQFRNAVLSGLGPGRRKIAVLDEFHNFVDPSFAGFLAQGRSLGGGAVMALQSLAQLAHGPWGRELLDELLANLSTIVVTPGCRPFDAAYFADLFGQQPRLQASWSYEARGPLEPRMRPAVRLEHRDAYRYTPTQIAELDPRHALVAVTNGRTAYPPTLVDVERA